MKTPMTWLLAGAAFTLCAGATVAVAAADPADAVRQAQEDAASARADAEQVRADAQKARDDARMIRDDARKARDDARVQLRDVRVYRHGDSDRDMIVIHGGDRSEMLSTMLQLRPDQEPALKAFLDATHPQRDGDRDRMIRFQREDDSRTTLQRLDEMQAKAAAQKAEMDRKVSAIKTFYGQLDAKQKKAFDAMPMLMMVGPNIGPMMIPGPMHIGYHYGREAIPPVPPVPPTPPAPPRAPRS